MTEQKLFSIVYATLLVYGIGSFLQLGSFVLPLPFFEIALALICFFLSTKVWKISQTLAILLSLYGVLQFLSMEYNYSFFLSDQSLERLSHSALTDILKICAHLLLVPIFIFQNKQTQIVSNPIVLSIFSFALLVCLFLPSPLWLIIPSFLWIVALAKNQNLFQKSMSFWLYIPLFILARELSLYFL